MYHGSNKLTNFLIPETFEHIPMQFLSCSISFNSTIVAPTYKLIVALAHLRLKSLHLIDCAHTSYTIVRPHCIELFKTLQSLLLGKYP